MSRAGMTFVSLNTRRSPGRSSPGKSVARRSANSPAAGMTSSRALSRGSAGRSAIRSRGRSKSKSASCIGYVAGPRQAPVRRVIWARARFLLCSAPMTVEQRRIPMARLTRRDFGKAAAAAALAASAFPSRSHAASSDKKTLRFIPQTDVQVLDPIWTTAYVTRNHGYMVFDTLFAIDSKFKPHPQMCEGFEVSSDKLNYSFVLRNGLKFHDGQPVRGADCVASLKRWMARDALGQTLARVIADMKDGDDKNFSIHLKEPFPLLIDGLAKISSLAPFIMPERLAKTDPFQQVTEMIGSGPFKFVKEEHQPGNKVVYVKNNDYVPRSEPAEW